MAEMNQEFEVDIRQYASVLWRRKWLILGLLVVSIISTYFLVNRMTPIYETSSTIMVQENDGAQNIFASDMFSMGKDLANTYSRILKTRSIMEEVIRETGLTDEEGKPISARQLQNKINVNSITGTDLIEISFQHDDPEEAVMLLNTLVNVFQERNLEMNKSAISGTRQFIEKQLEDTKEELDRSENDLLAFKQDNDVVIPTEEASQALQTLVELDSLKSMALVDQKSLESSIQATQLELAQQDETIITNTTISNNPLITQYKADITSAEIRLLELKSKYTDTHPDVIAAQKEVEKLQNALGQEMQEQVSSQTKAINPAFQSLYQNLVTYQTAWLANQAKIESYEQLVAGQEEILRTLPEKELNLARLERVNQVTSEIYTMLMTRLEETKITESMQTSKIFVVDPAYIPKVPIRPNKKSLLLLAAILALFVGMGLSLLIEYMNTTVKSGDELESMLNLPVLGSIPDMRKFKKFQE